MKINLEAPEGFSYVGWQRVVATRLLMDDNISRLVGDILAQPLGEASEAIKVCSNCFFVLSGEGFSLEDLAEVVRQRFADFALEVEVFTA